MQWSAEDGIDLLTTGVEGVGISIALRSMLNLLGALIMMGATSPRLMGVMVVLIPVVMLPLFSVGRRVRNLSRRVAEAWLALTSGQGEIGFGQVDEAEAASAAIALAGLRLGPRPRVVVPEAELLAHAARLDAIRKRAGGRTVWETVQASPASLETPA